MLGSNNAWMGGTRWRAADDHKDYRDQSEQKKTGDKQGQDKLMKPILVELMGR